MKPRIAIATPELLVAETPARIEIVVTCDAPTRITGIRASLVETHRWNGKRVHDAEHDVEILRDAGDLPTGETRIPFGVRLSRARAWPSLAIGPASIHYEVRVDVGLTWRRGVRAVVPAKVHWPVVVERIGNDTRAIQLGERMGLGILGKRFAPGETIKGAITMYGERPDHVDVVLVPELRANTRVYVGDPVRVIAVPMSGPRAGFDLVVPDVPPTLVAGPIELAWRVIVRQRAKLAGYFGAPNTGVTTTEVPIEIVPGAIADERTFIHPPATTFTAADAYVASVFATLATDETWTAAGGTAAARFDDIEVALAYDLGTLVARITYPNVGLELVGLHHAFSVAQAAPFIDRVRRVIAQLVGVKVVGWSDTEVVFEYGVGALEQAELDRFAAHAHRVAAAIPKAALVIAPAIVGVRTADWYKFAARYDGTFIPGNMATSGVAEGLPFDLVLIDRAKRARFLVAVGDPSYASAELRNLDARIAARDGSDPTFAKLAALAPDACALLATWPSDVSGIAIGGGRVRASIAAGPDPGRVANLIALLVALHRALSPRATPFR